MNSQLPLYEKLQQSNVHVDEDELAKVAIIVQKMELVHRENLFILIAHYYYIHHNQLLEKPYGSYIIAGMSGLIFNINKLPADLRIILAKYIKIATNYGKVDTNCSRLSSALLVKE